MRVLTFHKKRRKGGKEIFFICALVNRENEFDKQMSECITKSSNKSYPAMTDNNRSKCS